MYESIYDMYHRVPTEKEMWPYRNVFRSDINTGGTQTHWFDTYDAFIEYVQGIAKTE